MKKVLAVSAALAMALSGAAFAKGMKFGASADQYIDKNAQISAADCGSLSVASARNDCMSWAQAHGSADSSTSVGGTLDSGSGSVHGSGGAAMNADAPKGSNESKPESSSNQGVSGR